MKIYIIADQEGVAGVFDRKEKYLHACEYATMELAAVCESLLANGAGEILVNTIHVIDYHLLPKPVQILHGLERHDLFTQELDSSYDAVLLVGQHEMAGGREKGCWRHSLLPHPITFAYSSVEAVWLNDLLVGEIGLAAALAGIHNVPMVMVSGDYWACLEAKDLIPDMETVAVKKGTSYFSAVSMTPQAAAEASAKAAVRALAKCKKIKPLCMEGPVTIRIRYYFPERAGDAMTTVSGAKLLDEKTVAVTYPDMMALRDNFGGIRAPEHELYARDCGFKKCIGLFTRIGPEPYEGKK